MSTSHGKSAVARASTLALAFVALVAGGAGCSGDEGGGAGATDTSGGGATVVVNEIVAKAASGGPDWVELYNRTGADVDLAGYVLRDEDDAHEFLFPDGTTIPAGGFLVVEGQDGVGALVLDFGLGADDAVRLFDTSGALTDEADWADGEAPEGTSWGRVPDGTGTFQTLATPTPNAPNTAN